MTGENNGHERIDFLHRQEMMFTEDEVAKIKNAVVLIAGTGGLGTHQALELQRVGVRKIYLIDCDRVEVSNLNRQILYGKRDIGQFKAHRAKEVLDSFHLGTEVIALADSINENTVIPDDVQILFDALDNVESRFDLEKLAYKYNLPIVHGGIYSCSGQVTTIIPGQTHGFREIFGGVVPPKKAVPSFSPIVSMIAALQVVEGVKVILGNRGNLAGRLLIVDMVDYTFEMVEM